MQAPFLTKLQADITKEVSAIQEMMGSGGCSSFDAYQKKVGEIAGLEVAHELISTLLQSYEEED